MSTERAEQLVDAGIWLRLSGDIEGARRLFEQALKLDPQNARAAELLAQAPTAVVDPQVGGAKPPPSREDPFAPTRGVPDEVDWGAATDFTIEPARPPSVPPVAQAPPVSAGPLSAALNPFSLSEDRTVGSARPATPLPRQAPEVVGQVPLGDVPLPRTTVMFSLQGTEQEVPAPPETTADTATPSASSGRGVTAGPGAVQGGRTPSGVSRPVPSSATPAPVRSSGSGARPAAPRSSGSGARPRAAVESTGSGAHRVSGPSPVPSSGAPPPRGARTQLYASREGQETSPSVTPFVTDVTASSQVPIAPQVRPMPFVTETPVSSPTGPGRSPSRSVRSPDSPVPVVAPVTPTPSPSSSVPRSERPTMPIITPPPAEPAPAAPRTTALYSSRVSPAPLGPRTRTPPPTRSTPVPPSIPPVSPTPAPTSVASPQLRELEGLGAIGRSTMSFGAEEQRRPTLPFGKDEASRSTLQFGTSGPPAPSASSPRRTVMLQADPEGGVATPPGPAPLRSTIPYSQSGLSALDRPVEGPHHGTQVFSEHTAGPLGPSDVPDVRPLVVRIDLGDDLPEAPSIVDTLRDEVDAVGKPSARVVVLTDTTGESIVAQPPPPGGPTPSTPSLPGPPSIISMLSAPPSRSPQAPVMSPPSPLPPPLAPPPSLGAPRAASASEPPPRQTPAPSASEAAWNWSAASPPVRPLPSERVAPAPAPTPQPSVSPGPQASSAWDLRGSPGIRIDDVVGSDRTLELVSSDSRPPRNPESVRAEVSTLLAGARDLADLDDHTGAMELIAKAQGIAPDDPEIQRLREKSERTLLAMFESKLGNLESIPRVMLKDDEIIWLNLDHRAGFVLAQIDGTVSFEDLFAVSGMTRLDTSRILAQLVDEGVISRGSTR